MNETTRWEILDIPAGTIMRDWMHGDVRVLVVRGPSSLCAYVGIPDRHPLAGFRYDQIPLECHGGLTFAGKGAEGTTWPAGWYWYGWDYGHYGDAATYYYDREWLGRHGDNGKQWTIAEVEEEAEWVAYRFQGLCELAQAIWNKGFNCPDGR